MFSHEADAALIPPGVHLDKVVGLDALVRSVKRIDSFPVLHAMSAHMETPHALAEV